MREAHVSPPPPPPLRGEAAQTLPRKSKHTQNQTLSYTWIIALNYITTEFIRLQVDYTFICLSRLERA